MDPPDQPRFRTSVSRAFTPPGIADLEGRVRRLCATLLEPFVGTAGFDYVDQFAALLAPTVIRALLGFPEGDATEWRPGIDSLFHHEPGETGFKARCHRICRSVSVVFCRDERAGHRRADRAFFARGARDPSARSK